jgi:ABC-type multidrug transport system fused ATPase/permease subunit
MGGAGTFVTGIAGIVILWYGGHRVAAGAITVGELLFFYTLLAYMLDPLERLATVNLQIQDALVAIDRLYEIMDLEVEELDSPAKAKFEGVRDTIRFEGVSFGYGCRGNVLENVDLEVSAGSTIAIVGESGSGKSTLLKLLTRFHEPTKGRIVADGLDLRDFELTSLRSRIGLVSQEPYIFSGSIRENVAMGRPSTTLDEIVGVICAAGLSNFVDQLPERYETVIGERGANLSGGQRQRLAIARALLRRPEILIFDEATSHLDTATERAIRENLRSELADKTVVLVAHRLSTVMDADRIYVLEAGRIAEKGSHEHLLARGGIYASLWLTQSEGAEASASTPAPPSIGPDARIRRGANGSGELCAIT